jgi:hypothetical protein
MRMSLALGLQGRGGIRRVLAPLFRTWALYTLKRAIADVASMREQDYPALGFDKSEILTALGRLCDEIEDGEMFGARRSGRRAEGQLAIVVAKRQRRGVSGS